MGDSALSVLHNAKYLAHSQRGGYMLEARVLDKIGMYYSKKCFISSKNKQEEQVQQQQHEHHQYYNKYSHLAYTSFKDAIALRKLDQEEKQQKQEEEEKKAKNNNNKEYKKNNNQNRQKQQQPLENAFSLNEIGNIHYKENQYE